MFTRFSSTISDRITPSVKSDYDARIFDAYPELPLEDVYDLTEGFKTDVGVYFGSGGYMVSLRNPMGMDARSIFMHGYCALIAHLYAERENRDRFLLLTATEANPHFRPGHWVGHVLSASINDGKWVDFDGESTIDELKRDWPEDRYTYKVIDRKELMQVVFSGAEPFAILDELEQVYTEIVVDEIQSGVNSSYES